MPSQPKNVQHARVDVGADTESNATLSSRAQVVGQMAPLTPIYTTSVVFKTSIDDYVASGTVLAAADTKVVTLDAALTQARGDRDVARGNCRDCHAIAVAQVERYSVTAADLQHYGFLQLEVTKLGGVLPVGIDWTVDASTNLLHLHVRFADRARQCVVELSTDPIGAATWHRLEGHGVKRVVPGYAPGTYWAHAATSLAEGRSDWFGPVPIVIKA